MMVLRTYWGWIRRNIEDGAAEALMFSQPSGWVGISVGGGKSDICRMRESWSSKDWNNYLWHKKFTPQYSVILVSEIFLQVSHYLVMHIEGSSHIPISSAWNDFCKWTIICWLTKQGYRTFSHAGLPRQSPISGIIVVATRLHLYQQSYFVKTFPELVTDKSDNQQFVGKDSKSLSLLSKKNCVKR